MSTIRPDKLPKLDIASLSLDAAPAQAQSDSPTSSTSRGNLAKGGARRPSLTLPSLPPKSPPEATPAAHRALTQPNLTHLSTLKAPTQAARAQSAGQVSQIEGPNPSTTFTDLRGALPNAETADTHISTAKALANVIVHGAEGLKTAFGYDDKGHVVFGSHDELEQSKTGAKSTQHAYLLQRMGKFLKLDPSSDAETKKFGAQLFLATMRTGAAVPHGLYIGGTRLKQQDDGSLKFTVSDSYGFKNVTPAVLEPVAQFHANVLRLAGLPHKGIKGDGAQTDALAKRVSELLA